MPLDEFELADTVGTDLEARQGEMVEMFDRIQAGGTRVPSQLLPPLEGPIEAAHRLRTAINGSSTKDRQNIARAVGEQVQKIVES